MQDTRYLNLRKKLDSLSLTQTLHPTSVDLVQRLLSDYLKTLNLVEKERKLSAAVPPLPTSDYLSVRNQQLVRQVQELQQRVGKAQKLDNRVAQLTASLRDYELNYDAKVKEHLLQIQHLTTENNSLRHSLQSNECCSRESVSTAILEDEIRVLTARVHSSEKYAGELQALLQRKNREVKEQEELGSKYRVKISILESKLSEGAQVKDNKEARVIELLKAEIVELQVRMRAVREEGQRLAVVVGEVRMENNYLKNKQMECVVASEPSHFKTILENKVAELEDKREEIVRLQQQLGQSGEEVDKMQRIVKEYALKHKNISDHKRSLQQQITQLSQKYTVQMKRIRQLQAANHILQGKVKQNQLSQLQLSEEEYEGRVSRVGMLQREIELLRGQMQESRGRYNEMAVERQKVQCENRKLHLIVQENGSALQSANARIEEGNVALRESRRQCESVQEVVNKLRSELLVSGTRVEQKEESVGDLKAQLLRQRAVNEELQRSVRALGQQMQKQMQESKEIFEDNKMMAMQLKTLDARKNELQGKIKAMQEVEVKTYKQEYESMKVQWEERGNQLRGKENCILLLDNEKDQLQNQLDRTTEEVSELRRVLMLKEKEYGHMNRNISEKEVQYHSTLKKYQTIEEQFRQLSKQYQSLHQEHSELKRQCHKLSAGGKQLENEIHLLVLNKNELTKEGDRARNRIMDLERRVKEKNREYEEEKERYVSSNIMMNELQGQLQLSRGELMRVNALIKEFEVENNNMYNHLQSKDAELDQLHQVCHEQEKKEQALLMEINSYQRQLEIVANEHSYTQDLLSQAETHSQRYSSIAIMQDNGQERIRQLQFDYDSKNKENIALKTKIRELQFKLANEKYIYGSKYTNGNDNNGNAHNKYQINYNEKQRKELSENDIGTYVKKSNGYVAHSMPNCADNLLLTSMDAELCEETSVAKSIVDNLAQYEQQFMKATIPNFK